MGCEGGHEGGGLGVALQGVLSITAEAWVGSHQQSWLRLDRDCAEIRKRRHVRIDKSPTYSVQLEEKDLFKLAPLSWLS